MKKLTITFSIFMSLLFAAHSYAQTHNDTSKIVWPSTALPSITKAVDALIIIDGKIYKGDLNTINPNDIQSVDVYRDTAYTKMFGAEGASGVIRIKMKTHNKDTITAATPDTLKKQMQITGLRGHIDPNSILVTPGNGSLAENTSSFSGNSFFSAPVEPLCIVDGNVYPGGRETIDPNTIEKLTVLKGSDATFMYGAKAAGGAIVITTKKNAAGNPNMPLFGAIQSGNRKMDQYETKLSAISADYKSYLDSHNNDDSGINYIIDGSMIKHDTPGINALNDLDPDKIRNVSLLQKKDSQGITTTVVTIETTKN